MGDPKFRRLIRLCEQLIKLLENPQPGLFTWHEHVQQVRKDIWEYSSKED